MSTLGPTETTSTPMLPLRVAMEAGDLEAAVERFAPDAVVRSPLTDKLAFHGHEQIRAVLAVVLDVLEGLHYTDEVHSGDSAVLTAVATVRGRRLELADHMRLDNNGLVRELTVFFRPLPATAIALRLIGAGLARRRSVVRGALIANLARPLGFLTRVGDEVGVRLVRPTL